MWIFVTCSRRAPNARQWATRRRETDEPKSVHCRRSGPSASMQRRPDHRPPCRRALRCRDEGRAFSLKAETRPNSVIWEACGECHKIASAPDSACLQASLRPPRAPPVLPTRDPARRAIRLQSRRGIVLRAIACAAARSVRDGKDSDEMTSAHVPTGPHPRVWRGRHSRSWIQERANLSHTSGS